MDAAKLLEEYRLAQEEHERALAVVKEQRARVETARAEVEQARAVERGYERDMDAAAAKLVDGLRSLHLPEVDSSPLPNALPDVKESLVEYHANIGCYHCFLRLEEGSEPSAVDTSAVSVSVDLTKVTLTSATGVWWGVELERRVDAETCSITAKDDHVYVRLPIDPSNKEAVDGFSSFSQTTQDELRVESYDSLSCRGCGFVLMKNGIQIEKVLPLPSENWMEMFDFWGAGIGSFEHIPREGIFAHKHRVLVGESNVIFHEGDLTEKALVDTSDQPLTMQHGEKGCDTVHSDWFDVSCSSCKLVLGHRRVEDPATLRLSKHLLVAGGARDNVFDHYTIDSTVSAQMLHIAESDGVFRFLLSSEVAEGERSDFLGLQMQLLSWDTKILTTNAPAFRRVLKVIYNRVQDEEALPTQILQAELPPMLRIQRLNVSEAVGTEITRRLELSTLLLPQSQRSFNKMTVGYLYA